MTPNPWIYWPDFLFHITLGWAAFATALYTPLFSVWQILACVIATFALYRAVIFIHELAHLKEPAHDKAFYALCMHMEPDYHQLEFDLRLCLMQAEASGQPLWPQAGTGIVTSLP